MGVGAKVVCIVSATALGKVIKNSHLGDNSRPDQLVMGGSISWEGGGLCQIMRLL